MFSLSSKVRLWTIRSAVAYSVISLLFLFVGLGLRFPQETMLAWQVLVLSLSLGMVYFNWLCLQDALEQFAEDLTLDQERLAMAAYRRVAFGCVGGWFVLLAVQGVAGQYLSFTPVAIGGGMLQLVLTALPYAYLLLRYAFVQDYILDLAWSGREWLVSHLGHKAELPSHPEPS